MFRIAFFLVLSSALFLASCNKVGKLRGCVKVDGKYGYVDETGDFVIQPQYADAWSFVSGGAVVKINNKYGLIDKVGNVILAPRWDSVIPFSAECFIFASNGRFGFAAHGTGKELIAAQYEQTYYYTADLCVVQKGHALGIVNASGQLVCSPLLQDLKEMTSSLALVVTQDTSNTEDMLLALLEGGKDKKYGLINSQGKLVLPPIYSEIFTSDNGKWYFPFLQDEHSHHASTDEAHGNSMNVFEETSQPALQGKYGIVDSTGKLVVQPIYEQQPVYGDGMFRIYKNGKYGFCDESGNEIVKPVYNYATPYRDGYATVTQGNATLILDRKGAQIGTLQTPTSEIFRVSCGRIRFRAADGKYGYTDLTGKVVIEPQYQVADDFVFNRAIIEQNGRYGLIDLTGKFVSAPQWVIIYSLGDGYFHVKELSKTASPDTLQQVLDYLRNGRDNAGAGGVIDTNGRQILPVVFDEIYHLQPDYFTVEAGGMSGCYRTNGSLVYKPLSSTYLYFFQGRTLVKEETGVGIIDDQGKYLVQPQFDSIGMMYKGYAPMSRDGKFGLIDSLGHILVAPAYDEVQPLVNGFAVFQEKGKYGYLSVNGKQLFPAKFEEASPLIDPDRKLFD